MSSDIAIKVEGLSKSFRVFKRPEDRLKQFIFPKFQSLFRLSPSQFYEDFWAVKNVSFEIKKGETVGIIGKNGSGKSTLLQMICGTLNPTSGSIKVVGRIAALLELGSGFNPEFTGRENVYMNAAVLGLSRGEIDEKFNEILDFAGIGDFIDRPVKTYSSGMSVRLAFSVAASVSPDVLIVDEALAVGDPAFQAKCMKRFEVARQKGTTILLVTHDLGAILQFSSRCIFLDKGFQYNLDDPKEAVDAFKKSLLGISAIKENNRSCKQGEMTIRFDGAPWASAYSLNDGCEIYGIGSARIIDFGIFGLDGSQETQKILSGEQYDFRMRILFLERVQNPIFTLTFRDLTGKEIAGTNTLNQKVEVGSYLPGDKSLVSFQFESRLAPNNYLITFACSGYINGEFVVYERLYHILVLEVYSTKPIVGYFDLQAKITIDDERIENG